MHAAEYSIPDLYSFETETDIEHYEVLRTGKSAEEDI
jgi:hypothetical protein